MKKITTLFKKDPNNLSRVINEINPGNEWVEEFGVATRKFDGTAAAIINEQLYKRYDVKSGKQVPEGAIPCQDPDPITGHWPHWVICKKDNPEDKYFFEALNIEGYLEDGTYELCGPKINKNREGLQIHTLVRHGLVELDIPDLSFDGIREFLTVNDIEGVVFHHRLDGRMCKIRKSDFGIKRGVTSNQPT